MPNVKKILVAALLFMLGYALMSVKCGRARADDAARLHQVEQHVVSGS